MKDNPFGQEPLNIAEQSVLAAGLRKGIRNALMNDFAQTREANGSPFTNSRIMMRFAVMTMDESTDVVTTSEPRYIVIAELVGTRAKLKEGEDVTEVGGYDEEGNYTPTEEIPNFSTTSDWDDKIRLTYIDRATGGYCAITFIQDKYGRADVSSGLGGVVTSDSPSQGSIWGALGFAVGYTGELTFLEAVVKIENVLRNGFGSLDMTDRIAQFMEANPTFGATKVSPTILIENISYLNSILDNQLAATNQLVAEAVRRG